MDTNRSGPAPHESHENASLRGVQAAAVPYEPPQLSFVGRVHDLVAGGAGTTDEVADPFAKKMAGQPG